MKKKVITLLLASMMVLNVTACGNKENSSAAQDKKVEATASDNNETSDIAENVDNTTESDNVDVSDSAETSAGTQTASSLEEWLETDDVKTMVDTMDKAVNGLKIEMVADGKDVLVLRYTYEDQVDIADEAAKQKMVEYFDQQIEAQKSNFTPMFNTVEQQTGLKLSKLRIEYVNADGTEIYSTELENE